MHVDVSCIGKVTTLHTLLYACLSFDPRGKERCTADPGARGASTEPNTRLYFSTILSNAPLIRGHGAHPQSQISVA